MHHSSKLPPFHIAFSGLNSNSLQQTYQHDKNEQQPTYQGMPVQTLKSPFPVYVRLESTESYDFGEALPLPNEGACTPGMGKTSKTKYAASKKGKAARARYNASDNRKVSQAKYEVSEKGQAAKARKLARYALSREKRISQSRKNAKSYAYRSAIHK